MKILWVKSDFLHPTTRGGQIRTLEMLKRLHARHEVHYVAYDDPAQPEGLQRAKEYCSFVYPLKLSIPPRRSMKFVAQLVGNLFSPLPLSVARYYSLAMRHRIATLIESVRFDRIVCDFIFPAPNFSDISMAVIFEHNVETMIWRRHAEQAPDPIRKAYFQSQAERMFRFERDVCRAATRVVAVSPQDAALFKKMFDVDAVSVPTGVDLDYFRRSSAPAPTSDMVFVGSMDWLPNYDGVNYFVSEVLPLIRRRRPNCSLAIVGRTPSPDIQALAKKDPNIKVTGTVHDVRPYLWGAKLSIVPLRIGGGTRLKIYEAMAAGTATISTSIGAEGLHVSHPENIRLADTPQRFADECTSLLSDDAQREAVATAALRLVTAHFGWENITNEFERLLILP